MFMLVYLATNFALLANFPEIGVYNSSGKLKQASRKL